MDTKSTITNLADSILFKIFDKVALEDLLFSVAKVSARWSALVNWVCHNKTKLYLYSEEYHWSPGENSMQFLEMTPTWAGSNNLLVLNDENKELQFMERSLPDMFDSIEELSIYEDGLRCTYEDLSSMLLKWSSTLVTLKIDSDNYSELFKLFEQLYVNGQCLLPKLKSLSISDRSLVAVPVQLITQQLQVFNLFGLSYGQSYKSLCEITKKRDQVAPSSLTLKHFSFAGKNLEYFHRHLEQADLGSRFLLKRLSLVSNPILYKELADICRFYKSISYLSLEIRGSFLMEKVLTAIVPLRQSLRRLKIFFRLLDEDGNVGLAKDIWSKHHKSLCGFQVQFELVQSVRLVTKDKPDWSKASSIYDISKDWSNVGATAQHLLYSQISRIFPKAKFYTSL